MPGVFFLITRYIAVKIYDIIFFYLENSAKTAYLKISHLALQKSILIIQ